MKKLILAGLMIAFVGIAGVVIADNNNPVIANLVNNSGTTVGYMIPGYHSIISKSPLMWSDIAKACGNQESCNQIYLVNGESEMQITPLKVDSARRKFLGIASTDYNGIVASSSGNTITIESSKK